MYNLPTPRKSKQNSEDRYEDLMSEIQALRLQNNLLAESFHVQSLALGRIIALLDPMFVIPESHPLRRADSDRIGAEVIKKLRAEAMARGDI